MSKLLLKSKVEHKETRQQYKIEIIKSSFDYIRDDAKVKCFLENEDFEIFEKEKLNFIEEFPPNHLK